MGRIRRSQIHEHASNKVTGPSDQPPGEQREGGKETEGTGLNGDNNGKQNGGYVSGQDEMDNFIKKGLKRKRIFRLKESILTELSSTNKHFQALYHAFMVMIITGIGYSLVQDTVEAGKPYVNFAYYFTGFGPVDLQLLAVVIWAPLQVAAFALYPVFKMWQWLHSKIGLTADVMFLVVFIAYILVTNFVVVKSIVYFDLPPVPALVLAVEQLRFNMKSYSFVRENAYKVLYPWHKDDESGPAVWYEGQMEPQVGSFSQYVYFLFAPTLLYRDRYPRLPRRSWLRVLSHLFKCVVSITFVTILVKEIFENYPTTQGPADAVSGKMVANTFLMCMLWGLMMQFMAGYFFLHSWSNLFGELLRFADREFYSDWWTCTTFSSFYRKWNLLVHDWIKAYIYQDFKDLFKSRTYNKLASFPPIFISALYHEFMIWAPMRFVLPVLLLNFGIFGVLLYFVRASPTSQFWNYFIHFALNLGVALMLFLYSMEFTARNMCVREVNFMNTFIPRSYECFITGSYHGLNVTE